jgi:hypothetical protein
LPPSLAVGCKNENRYLGFSQRKKNTHHRDPEEKEKKRIMFIETQTLAGNLFEMKNSEC